MSCPSSVLNALSYGERKSLAGIVAVSLPAEDLADGNWSIVLLEDILQFLDLDKQLAEGFQPITERSQAEMLEATRTPWSERIKPFLESLPSLNEKRTVALRDLMVLVALHCGYDARTRVTFRKVCHAMGISWHPRVSEVEGTLARKVYERVNQERERELRGDRWRGFKIGAAMVGGGALLAVTGGLAAPALAAGITASSSVIGASAAATLSSFATTAWMATVFGATGAGLVGFKMDRRTKGVKEFEFDSETAAGENMCVSICVSGVLKDKADLQRSWGVEPRGPSVTAAERLKRFYYVHNKDKVKDVELMLEEWKGKEAKLCKAILARYGADPRVPPTREELALAEGRNLEGVAQNDIDVDAEAIGHLMEAVLAAEKERFKAAAKEAAKKKVSPRTADRELVETAKASGSHATSGEPGADVSSPPPPYVLAAAEASSKSTEIIENESDPSRPAAAPGTICSSTEAVVGSPVDAPKRGDPELNETRRGELLRGFGERGTEQVKPAGGQPEAEKIRQKFNEMTPVDPGAAERVANRLAQVQLQENNFIRCEGQQSIRWAQVALRRSKGDEKLAEEFVQIRTDEEMDALVAEDEKQEQLAREKEEKEAIRVWFWQDKVPRSDQYVLRWEADLQIEIGKSVQTIMKSLRQSAMMETLKYTTFAAVISAISWPLTLISLANIIDADWTIGKQRADLAGKILADALLNREQGCRPVTLVGTSLGARLIFSCLEEIARRHELWEEQQMVAEDMSVEAQKRRRERLARLGAIVSGSESSSKRRIGGGKAAKADSKEKTKGDARSAAGIIENVMLLGTPIGASPGRWERVARVVHGRIINGYSKSDVILGLVFRAKSLSLSVAGVQKVEAAGVENVDLTPIIGSDHFHYNRRMPEILPVLGLDDCSKYVFRGDDPMASADSKAKTPAVGIEAGGTFFMT